MARRLSRPRAAVPASAFGRLVCWMVVMACFSCTTTTAARPGKPLEPKTSVQGVSGRFEFQTPSRLWERHPPGTVVTWVTTELELTAPESGALLFVTQERSPSLYLPSIVANRRTALFSNGYTSYRELRRFLPRDPLVVASFARYVRGNEVLLVLTAIDESIAIEVFATISRGRAFEPELLEMLESLRFVRER